MKITFGGNKAYGNYKLKINKMMQNMYIAYLRGYEGKPRPKYIRGSLLAKKYKEGESDMKNNLPNRYESKNNTMSKELILKQIEVKKYAIKITTTLIGKITLEQELDMLYAELEKS